MKRLIQVLCLAVTCTAGAQLITNNVIEGFTGSTTNSTSLNTAGTAGFVFQPGAQIELLALGCYGPVVDSQGSIQVGLWDKNGTLLASNLITAASTPISDNLFETVSNLFLYATNVYFLGAYSPNGIGLEVIGFDQTNSVVLGKDVTLNVSGGGGFAYGNTGFQKPALQNGTEGAILLGPNLRYRFNPGTVSPILLTLQRSGAQGVLTWANPLFSLQSAPAVTGPWTTLAGATSPWTVDLSQTQQFFRLKF